MSTQPEATIDDSYHTRGKSELINGKIVVMPPSGGFSGVARAAISSRHLAHEKATGQGHALPGPVGYLVDLPHRKSFCPDVSYTVAPLSMEFVKGAPVFAVEIRNEPDHGPDAERRIAAKHADYFAAGTLVVWDVDLQGADTTRSYRAESLDLPLVFRRGDTAHAEPAVPGWSMPVDDLFP